MLLALMAILTPAFQGPDGDEADLSLLGFGHPPDHQDMCMLYRPGCQFQKPCVQAIDFALELDDASAQICLSRMICRVVVICWGLLDSVTK